MAEHAISPDQHRLTAQNVVAAFATLTAASTALDKLRSEGFVDGELSLLTRDSVISEADDFEEPRNLGATMAEGVAKGGLAGAGVGGVAGLVAGALAFGIPGIGPAVGVGIWAATAGGAAAGATAGGLVGAFGHMWDARYRDMVREGHTLVGVHIDDRERADRAYRLLQELHPVHVAHFDRKGAVINEADAPAP
jgi:hypothetical protein